MLLDVNIWLWVAEQKPSSPLTSNLIQSHKYLGKEIHHAVNPPLLPPRTSELSMKYRYLLFYNDTTCSETDMGECYSRTLICIEERGESVADSGSCSRCLTHIPMGWLTPGSKITYLERWSLEGQAQWNNPLMHSECILCFSMATVVIAEYKKHSQLQLDCSHALWIYSSLWRTRLLIWIATALK